MSTSEFDTQLKSAWGNSSTYCTAYTFFEQGFTAAWNANRNSTKSIRNLVNEAAMQLLVDKVNELQKKVDELEELQEEALLSLRVADKFCGQLTSDECSDSVHIPIQDTIKKIVKYNG